MPLEIRALSNYMLRLQLQSFRHFRSPSLSCVSARQTDVFTMQGKNINKRRLPFFMLKPRSVMSLLDYFQPCAAVGTSLHHPVNPFDRKILFTENNLDTLAYWILCGDLALLSVKKMRWDDEKYLKSSYFHPLGLKINIDYRGILKPFSVFEVSPRIVAGLAVDRGNLM